jgi:hypothetical protein
VKLGSQGATVSRMGLGCSTDEYIDFIAEHDLNLDDVRKELGTG